MLISVHYKLVFTQSFITLMMAVVTDELCQFSNNLDSTCVLIGLQVCFHSAMKHENGVMWFDCFRVVRIYSTRFVYRLCIC